MLFQSVSNIIGRRLAAVGADLSCPHIGIHPQNDERKHVCSEMDMCICLCQNTGAMNRSPTPSGVFRGYFVGECWVFTECFVAISWVFVALLTIRSQRNGRLLAAVGADLSCPHIGIHPQNDERKHVCGEMDTRIQ